MPEGLQAVTRNAMCDSFRHLHHLQSDVVRLDSNGNVTHTFKSVGTKANGLAMWRQYLVVLDSEAAAINLVDSTTGAVLQVFKVSFGLSWKLSALPLRHRVSLLVFAQLLLIYCFQSCTGCERHID